MMGRRAGMAYATAWAIWTAAVLGACGGSEPAPIDGVTAARIGVAQAKVACKAVMREPLAPLQLRRTCEAIELAERVAVEPAAPIPALRMDPLNRPDGGSGSSE